MSFCPPQARRSRNRRTVPRQLLRLLVSYRPKDPRADVLPIVNFANCTGTCSVPITGFISVYILGVGRWGSYVQDIGMVIRNTVGSVTAVNDGAMGDVMLVQSYQYLSEASDALGQAQEVLDYQFQSACGAARLCSHLPMPPRRLSPGHPATRNPRGADLRAWADHICNVAMVGDSHNERRPSLQDPACARLDLHQLADSFKSSKWQDAEAAVATTANAITLSTSSVIRYMRSVPETCPVCGSHRLSPERSYCVDRPDIEWDRTHL
jgi:hypothetical protein